MFRDRTALSDTELTDTGLADPGLADPGLADPGLADPGAAKAGQAKAGPAPGKVRRWWATFADPALEEAFRQQRLGEQRRLALVMVATAGTLPQLQLFKEIPQYLRGSVEFGPLVLDRLLSIAVGIGMLIYLARVRSRLALEVSLFLYGLFLAAISGLVVLHYPGVNIMATTSIVSMAACVYFFAPLPFAHTMAVAVVMSIIGEIAWGVLHPEQTWQDAFRLLLWLIGVNVVGFFSCNAFNRTLRELFWRERQLAQQTVRTEAAYQREKIAFDRFRQFAAMISHEFRNPLAIVKSKSQLLQLIKDVGGPDDPQALAAIERAADRLDTLFSQWLAHDRLSEGDITLDIREMPLTELFRRLEREAPVSPAHTLSYAPGPDGLAVKADQILLPLILLNLIDNAVKYSPNGGVIGIAAKADGDDVLIAVRDQGQGIAPDHIDKVFDKYFRVSHDSRVQGFGIGLFLVRHFMTLQGGSVAIASTVGRGTTVTLRLPLAHTIGSERT